MQNNNRKVKKIFNNPNTVKPVFLAKYIENSVLTSYSSERLLRVLKFGKTSNRAVENLSQRKLLSLSSERCTLSSTELPRVFI